MQVENPQISESGFTLDRIMHLHINFHQLLLMLGSSYIELPKWIAKEKAVINKKKNNEQCFKWVVIALFHHEDITHHPKRISIPQYYEVMDQYYDTIGEDLSSPSIPEDR